MNTLIKRVTQDKFEKEIEDYTVAGWALKSRSDRFATMEKHGGYGQPVVHIIIFIFFGWWNFLLGNLIYAVYSYMSGTQALHIRVDDTVNTTSPAAPATPVPVAPTTPAPVTLVVAPVPATPITPTSAIKVEHGVDSVESQVKTV